MLQRGRGAAIWLATTGLAIFIAGNWVKPPPKDFADELSIVLNVPLQIITSACDRYLAANAGVWRAIVVDATKMSPSTLSALAKIQEDASWLNPAHEDNYYIAAAILPWEGEVARGQTILARAMEARHGDILPAFFYGFNQLQFLGDWKGAYKAALIGAERAGNDGDRQLMTVMAARWSERSDDLDSAIRATKRLAENSKDKALQDYLRQRLRRLENLGGLRMAAREFERRTGQKLSSLDELISAGLISQIPPDEVGLGYEVVNHLPVLREKHSGNK